MYKIIIVCIFILANNIFFLFPWSKIDGKFNSADLGIVWIVFWFIILMFKKRSNILLNPISYFLIFQLFFCLFHIGFVVVKFDYPVIEAIIASRSYLYYLSFFVFLLLIDSKEKLYSIMSLLFIVSMIVFALSIINYCCIVMFYHPWAEGHYERSGITRAFVPGMEMFSMLAIWSFVNSYSSYFCIEKIKWGFKSILLFAVHVFRQSRVEFVGILFSIFLISLLYKKYKVIFVYILIASISLLSILFIYDIDIVGGNVELTTKEIQESKGSFGGRLIFLEKSLEALMESPIVGTGGSAIRAFRGAYQFISDSKFQKYYTLGKQSDIGLFNWLKNFGLIGLLWGIGFGSWLFISSYKSMRDTKYSAISVYCFVHLCFFLITSITHEHLINYYKIPPVMFCSAIIVRLKYGFNKYD